MKIIYFIIPVFAHNRHIYSDYDKKHEAFGVKRVSSLNFFWITDKGEHHLRPLCESVVGNSTNQKTRGIENRATKLSQTCRIR